MPLEPCVRALLGRVLRVLSLKLKHWAAGSVNVLLAVFRLVSRFFKPSGDRQSKGEARDGPTKASSSSIALVPCQPYRRGSPTTIIPSEHPMSTFFPNPTGSTVNSPLIRPQPLPPGSVGLSPDDPILITVDKFRVGPGPSPTTPLSSRDPSRQFGLLPQEPEVSIGSALVSPAYAMQSAFTSAPHSGPSLPSNRILKAIHAGEFKRYERSRLRYVVNFEEVPHRCPHS